MEMGAAVITMERSQTFTQGNIESIGATNWCNYIANKNFFLWNDACNVMTQKWCQKKMNVIPEEFGYCSLEKRAVS